ncbi:hypothetical protein B4U79_00739, partial [Dinothrombium tinctorium]
RAQKEETKRICMSSKVERPTLQGQRIKTRKRDEKEKFDPSAFRDSILLGFFDVQQKQSPHSSDGESDSVSNSANLLNNGNADSDSSHSTGGNYSTITKAQLDAIHKFLDTAGSKLDYRRYGEVLFDILIAGGYLAPGGTIVTDPDPLKASKTDICVFSIQADDVEAIRGFAQIIVKLTRRYMYLEKTLEDEFKKIIKFLKGFSPEDRLKLAKLTAILISGGQVPATVLTSALQDHFVKDGIAIDFLVAVLQTWVNEKDATTVWATLKKAGLDNKVMDFLPVSKRTPEYLMTVFLKGGLDQLLSLQKASLGTLMKKELQNQVAKSIKDVIPVKEIIALVKDYVAKNNLPEAEVAVLLWNTLMAAVEWNKKEELVAEQALKHLKGYTSLLAAFTQSAKSELALIIRIQEYCYENMNFLKVFQKIILLFYKADILSEDIIIKWYNESHSSRGKSVFLEQMKKFVEWLQNAEEGNTTKVGFK